MTTYSYNKKCCGMCANYEGDRGIRQRSRYNYKQDCSAKGRCRYYPNPIICSRMPCSHFDELPGFNP